jgi:hypothetical protein
MSRLLIYISLLTTVLETSTTVCYAQWTCRPSTMPLAKLGLDGGIITVYETFDGSDHYYYATRAQCQRQLDTFCNEEYWSPPAGCVSYLEAKRRGIAKGAGTIDSELKN